MNGWPETPEAGSRPWLLRRNVFESLAVVLSVSRRDRWPGGGKEGRKEGREKAAKGTKDR